MKVFLSALAVVLFSIQSHAEKVRVPVRPSTYKVEILSVTTKPYYFKEILIENCDPSIVLEGGSGCVDEIKVNEPVLEISYQTEDDDIENDPVDGGRLGKLTLLLKNMSETTAANFLSNEPSSLLQNVKDQAKFSFESKAKNVITCGAALENGSDCPDQELGQIIERFLIIELN